MFNLVLSIFFRYLYTDILDYTNWQESLYLATLYEVKPLIEKIFDEKVSTVTPGEFFELVQRYKNMDGYLEYRCMKHVFDNQKLIFDSDSFYHLPYSFVLKVVSSDQLVIDENLIYNALFLWAEKACFEKSLEGTGENKRKVLGDIIYHIRFPLLPQEFFSDHVSEQGLLEEADEIKILKRYLHPTKPLGPDFRFKTEPRKVSESGFPYIPSKFERWRPVFDGCDDEAAAASSFEMRSESDSQGAAGGEAVKARQRGCLDGLPTIRPEESLTSQQNFSGQLENDVGQMIRFNERDMYSGWGYKKETVDAIAFSSSADIALYTIQVYGAEAGKKMTGQLKIFKGNTEACSQEFSFTCFKEKKTYDIYLEKLVKVLANQEYHILLDIEEGLSGFYGKGGKSCVKVGEMNFSIKTSKYSTNHTDVSMGQIFGFKFYAFKPVHLKYGINFNYRSGY